MDKKIWWHPFANDVIKRKFWTTFRKPKLSANGLNARFPAPRDRSEENTSRMHPWTGLFDDPALHEALDRIMASNHIA